MWTLCANFMQISYTLHVQCAQISINYAHCTDKWHLHAPYAQHTVSKLCVDSCICRVQHFLCFEIQGHPRAGKHFTKKTTASRCNQWLGNCEGNARPNERSIPEEYSRTVARGDDRLRMSAPWSTEKYLSLVSRPRRFFKMASLPLVNLDDKLPLEEGA